MAAVNFNHQQVVDNAGRVGVLMGGLSAEREISLKSGHEIHRALEKSGVESVAIIWDDDLTQVLNRAAVDRIFIALHGRGGEDGHVQGMLELMGIPYTGSGVLGSALAMDKMRCKQVWLSAGLPTPPFVAATKSTDLNTLTIDRYPVAVKPTHEGSSIGVTKVTSRGALVPAIHKAFEYDDTALIEQWIEGEEYTLSILGGETLPIIKLVTPNEFYDYEAKYLAHSTQYLCPCGLDRALEAHCEDIGLRAFVASGADGWGRVDFMIADNGEVFLIEVNTVPGMTDHSLVPMAAAASGIAFEELVLMILATSFKRGEG